LGKPITLNLGFAVWSTSIGKPLPLAKGKAKTLKLTLLEPIYSWHERAERGDKHLSSAVYLGVTATCFTAIMAL
jgi:hypothetical protein